MAILLDFQRIATFTDGDPGVEDELLGLFFETAATYLEALARAGSEPAPWQAAAHSLKGAAGNIGAVALAELAATAERAAPDANLLAALEATFAATRTSARRRAA
jgi:HPt (histidine-containing phosphotransfer) domain-containing protein